MNNEFKFEVDTSMYGRIKKYSWSYKTSGTIKARWLGDNGMPMYVFRFDNPSGSIQIFNEKQIQSLFLEKVFLLDMDGVVCNFVNGLIKSHKLGIKHDEYITWNHHRTFGISDEELWLPTNNGKWWTELEEYKWAKELVSKLRSIGKVIFCTSPSLDSTCPSQKVQWLRDHGLMDMNKNDYQIGNRKELNAGFGAILIDDSENNVKKFIENGGKAILFPQPWNYNRGLIGDRIGYTMEKIRRLFSE